MVAAASEDDKSGVAPRSHQGKGPDQIIEPLLRRKAADADDDRRPAFCEPGMLGRCLSQRCDRVGDDRIVDDADLRAVQANDMLQIVCDARRNGDDGIRGRVELPDQMGHHRRASVLPEGNRLGHRVMLTDDEATGVRRDILPIPPQHLAESWQTVIRAALAPQITSERRDAT